jgi:hypothetical protein
LPEAVESLSNMYEFYRSAFATPPALIFQGSTPARITGSYVEPVYPVTEE